MVNWRELGEVPDSEDEDTLDSQETIASTRPAQFSSKKEVSSARPTKTSTEDVWSVPDSPKVEQRTDARQAVAKSRRSSANAPVPVIDSSPLSSPLSSALSDLDLESIDPLALSDHNSDVDPSPIQNEQPVIGNDEISRSYVQLSPSLPVFSTQEPEHQGSLPSFENDPVCFLQSQELGYDARHQAHQAAVRYERSLRPRKPIQEHPYVLENAHYSSMLKRHDVRPLRIAIERERRRRQQGSQEDQDFEDDSQESRLIDISDESQLNGLEEFLDGLDSLDVPSTSPPKTSPVNDRAGRSSQMNSDSDTDNTSLAAEDLPALEKLLKQRPLGSHAKRIAFPPRSSARKRQRRDVVDSDPLEPAANLRLVPGPVEPFQRQEHEKSFYTLENGTGQSEPPTAFTPTPTPRPRADSQTIDRPQPSRVIIESDSEEELSQTQGQDEHENAGDTSQSEPESDSEMVHAMSRRIRGVLPASWIRLDQQAAQNKTPRKAMSRTKNRSPEREPRRGVAQTRIVSSRHPATSTIFFDESDEETSAPKQRTTDDVFHQQGRLVLQDTSQEVTAEDPIWDDDSVSIEEDDTIDLMLPARKRQLKLSESFSNTTKRTRAPNDMANPVPAKKPRQPKITSAMGILSGGNITPARYLVKKRYREPLVDSAADKKRGHRAKKARRLKVPPKLSILDVVEQDAPRFLKIAARSARRRQDKGRSSPSKKSIRLASREDQIDALSVLQDWKAGSIPQRPSVSEARKKKQTEPRVLTETSANISATFKKPRPLTIPRRLIKQNSIGGSTRYQSGKHSAKQPVKPRRTHSGAFRLAQLETDETDLSSNRAFSSTKNRLDRLYRNQLGSVSGNSLATALDESSAELPCPASPPPQVDPPLLRELSEPTAKSRYRKQRKPRRVDVEAPQYSRAHDPLPLDSEPILELAPQTNNEGQKLRGLGPYGTNYTQHFEIFPLDSGVYFHESTLIGCGIVEAASRTPSTQTMLESRPRTSYNLSGQNLRWGAWDAQVSSELGVVLDYIAEQLEISPNDVDAWDPGTAKEAARFIMKYSMDSLNFADLAGAMPFVLRIVEVFRGFDNRVKALLSNPTAVSPSQAVTVASVYDSILLTSLHVTRICQNEPSLMSEQFQMEDLVTAIAKTAVSALIVSGIGQLRNTYHDLGDRRTCERGLRDEAPAIHSWVIIMKVLERARIPRASFWDVTYAVLVTNEVVTSSDAQEHERVWRDMFTLLPLIEFNDQGMIVAGKRHDASADGWALPQKLLRKVFQLYKENERQAPSFNSYCFALVGRCHYLVQQWGWHKCVAVVGVVFDFFGSQNLAHLRNEEVYQSPRFLEQLSASPSLDIEPGDRCFHVFLKLVALSIRKLTDVGLTNDVRNLVARTTPNHNRQCLKEQNIHERDLAALRNHHDLLCTLFWAAPSDLRPALHHIESLVVPASSHKEACLISLRAWSQLARYLVSSGQASTSFRPFAKWRTDFFQAVLYQFDSVEYDMQQQFLTLAKDGSNSVSPELRDAMISLNKTAIMDVLHFSVTASLGVMREAPDLEAASFAFNMNQLRQIFKHFTAHPSQLDWSVLRAALMTLDVFLSRIDEFKEAEESQQSQSEILNSAQADDAIILLNEELAPSFFPLARFIMSPRGAKELGALAATDKAACTDLTITLSARLGARFMNGGLARLSGMFKSGRYGLFENVPSKLGLVQRKWLVLFIQSLLKHGFDDFSDASFTLLEVWMLSLVKPRSYLAYENQLAEELLRNQQNFVPGAVVGLAISPDYNSNRDLFEFAISWMRKSLRDAGPSLRKIMLSEYSNTLKTTMRQIKDDLRVAAQDTLEHPAYVAFIRDIIGLIRAHGAEVCTVDDFFYQINKEYSPSAHDPQLQVAAIASYGLRLSEGDSKVLHQLFFFLFNNFKMSLINDKLGNEVALLHRGMRDLEIRSFIFGKLFPAVYQASLLESSVYPLVDVYAEATRVLLSGSIVPFELTKDDLPHVVDFLKTSANYLDRLAQTTNPLTDEQIHLLRQLLSIGNEIWPSIYVLSFSVPEHGSWEKIEKAIGYMRGGLKTALVYLSDLMDMGETRLQVSLLLQDVRRVPNDMAQNDTTVRNFVGNIVNDVRKNWIESDNRVTVQAPGKVQGSMSTQSGLGTEKLAWDRDELVSGLHEQVKEWNEWWSKVYGEDLEAQGHHVSVLF